MPSTPSTFLTTVVLATVLAVGGCSSKASRIQSGLDKASAFVSVAEWDKASVEIRNVLQIEPKTARAQYIAGQIAQGQGDIRRAYALYLKAIELQPAYPDAQVAVARLYLYTNDLARAESAIDAVLAAQPKNLGALTLRAALEARLGKADQALADAQRLVDENKPVPVDAAMLLAGLHANAGRPAQALAVIDRALADDPKNISLLQVAAEVSAANPNDPTSIAKADGYFGRAVAQAPRDDQLWKAWAGLYLRRGDVARAEQVLREAVAADRRDAGRQTLLLEFLAARRPPDVAEKAYAAAIAQSPEDATLRFGLANLYRATLRPAGAQRVLREIVDTQGTAPPGLAARNQLAAYQLAIGHVDEARTLVAEVLKSNPRDNDALLLRGRMSLRDGHPKDAILDLRAVAKDQPGAAQVVSLLAQAHHAAGEPQLAREVIADAVQAKPADPALHLQLAADMADAKDYDAALGEADAAIKLAPKLVPAYALKARIALARKDTALAERTYLELKAATPGESTGYVEIGKFYADTRRYGDALKMYDAALAARPNDVAPYLAATALLIATGRFDEANARIEQRRKADPSNMLHDRLLGDVAIARHDLDAAEKAYRAVIALAPKVPVGYVETARVLGMRGDIPGAVAVLADGEKAVPGEITLPMARAQWLVQAKRYEEAIGVYEAVLAQAPDNDAVANNLAYLLSDTRGDRASLQRALSLAGRFAESRNPSFLDSLGWIRFKLGEYDKAVPVLERANALDPDSPLLKLHLGRALVQGGDAARGRLLLRQAVDSQKDLPHLDEARAILAKG